MWGFWWIFPLIGLFICLVCVVAMVRAMRGGGQFMCMSGHRDDASDAAAELRRELRELREEVGKLKAER